MRMADSDTGAGKKTGSLDLLSKEDLVGKCKALLQIAQKAKKAKDDALDQNKVLQTDLERDRNNAVEQICNLENRLGDFEDLMKAKQRQIGRLSEENDSLLEQIDTYSSHLKVIAHEKAEVETNLASLKESLDTSERNSDTKVKELEASLICSREGERHLRNQLKTTEHELDENRKECLTLKERNKELVQQADSSRAELADLEVKITKADEKLKCLQQMVADERRGKADMEKCKEQVSANLKSIVDEKVLVEEKVEQFKVQVLQLEESLSKEKENAGSLKAELTESEAEVARMKEEVAELVKEKQKVLSMDKELVDIRQCLELKEKEFVKISKEFENYKLRAQNVLKQSKEKSSGDIEVLEKKQEELLTMEKLNETLEAKVASVNLQIKSVMTERSNLQDEIETNKKQYCRGLEAQEKNSRERIEEQNAIIREMLMTGSEKTREVEKLEKLIDTLRLDHQKEVEMLKSTNLTELSRLRQELDGKKTEVMKLASSIELVLRKEEDRKCQDDEGVSKPGEGNEKHTDICKVDRGACVGKEVSVSPILPLEQLLSETDDIQPCIINGESGRRVSHLAALLSESEAQNSRLEKLTDVLKEEIRTYQRSEERHKHIENLEYVKNVFLKFLTLTGAQERRSLIPVLETILKLKKEETERIEELVRAEEASSSGGEGWGKYLRLWETSQ